MMTQMCLAGQDLTALRAKNFFLVPHLTLTSFSLKPFPLCPIQPERSWFLTWFSSATSDGAFPTAGALVGLQSPPGPPGRGRVLTMSSLGPHREGAAGTSEHHGLVRPRRGLSQLCKQKSFSALLSSATRLSPCQHLGLGPTSSCLGLEEASWQAVLRPGWDRGFPCPGDALSLGTGFVATQGTA